MSAGQESGSPIRENRTLLPAPLPPDEARGTLAAAAGVSTVGLRPPFDTPQRHSHPVCRAILTLIVALETPDSDAFDPMKEPWWTLPMAAAWVIWRTPAAVRRVWQVYRSEVREWCGPV